MGDTMKKLFGGSKTQQKSEQQATSESQSQSTSGSFDLTSDELKKLREPFVSGLTALLGGGGPAWDGPFVAGMTQGEGQALGQVDAAANNANRTGLIDDTLKGKYLNSNPHLEEAIKAAQRPTFQGLEEVLGRVLPGRFAQAGHLTNPNKPGSGGGSSAFDRAAAIATRGATQAAADIATNMSNESFKNERVMQQQAITMSQQDVDTFTKNLQAQGLPRLIEDLGIERALDEFKSRTDALIKAFAVAAGSPIAVVGQESQSTSSSKSQSTGSSSGQGEDFGGGVVGTVGKVMFPKGLQGG
jgi:hypothetical protein